MIARCAALMPLLHGLAFAQSACEVLDLSLAEDWTDGAYLGFSVALQDDRLAVTQRAGSYTVGIGSEPGTVHLYRREGLSWIPDGVVQGADTEMGDDFGWSIALDGDRLLVGAKNNGWFNVKGAAYVFERQGDGDWVETAKLVPDEPLAIAVGWSVALDGDTAVLGAKGAVSLGSGSGRAYVYENVGGTWQLEQELLPSFSAVGDAFGISVDVDGDRIVVGASYQFTAISPYHGWAFVFDKMAGTWVQTAALTGADSADADVYGQGVAVEGDTVVVGAPFHDATGVNAGALYVYSLDDRSWIESAKLVDSAPFAQLSHLGWSLDLEPGRILAGADQHWEKGERAGAAYLFEEVGGSWELVSKFWGSKLVEDSNFGISVDLDGGDLLVGAAGVTGALPGTAYLFSLTPGAHLVTDTTGLSLSAGDQQTLHLGGCPDSAGDLYAVAGTTSGTSPGFAFAGLPVPLNPDAYFLHTINHPASPPLGSTVGFLDAFGCAEATFGFAPGADPALAGTLLHHAWARLDPATLALEAVSAAAPVTLVP